LLPREPEIFVLTGNSLFVHCCWYTGPEPGKWGV
jgi:hypothetical protein